MPKQGTIYNFYSMEHLRGYGACQSFIIKKDWATKQMLRDGGSKSSLISGCKPNLGHSKIQYLKVWSHFNI